MEGTGSSEPAFGSCASASELSVFGPRPGLGLPFLPLFKRGCFSPRGSTWPARLPDQLWKAKHHVLPGPVPPSHGGGVAGVTHRQGGGCTRARPPPFLPSAESRETGRRAVQGPRSARPSRSMCPSRAAGLRGRGARGSVDVFAEAARGFPLTGRCRFFSSKWCRQGPGWASGTSGRPSSRWKPEQAPLPGTRRPSRCQPGRPGGAEGRGPS